MTRDEIIQLIVSYSKRPDLETEIETYFLPLSESRIGRDLRAFENETKTDLVFTGSNVQDLPLDYGSIRAVYPPDGRGPALKAIDIITLAQYRVGFGQPGVYNIRGKSGFAPEAGSEIEVRPYGDGDTLPLYYFARPQFGINGEANAVSARWPQLYLYAALIELHIWEKNQEALGFVSGLYGPEIKTINRDADRARGSKPAMRIS